jgi:hypothetical protein
MQNSIDAKVAELERDWPDWQIWVVHRAVGGPVWCARRRDGQGRVLNANSSAELVEPLEGEPGTHPDGIAPTGMA